MNNLNEIWKEALAILNKEVSSVSFETWFKPVVAVDFSSGIFTIAAESDFFKGMLNVRYNTLICNALSQVLSETVNLNIILTSQIDDFFNNLIDDNKFNFSNTSTNSFNTIGLNSKYTFDTFVVGAGNRFAHAASLAVAETPAQAYNPLFLYGCSGLGKTHLMHAIGNYISSMNPNLKIMYVSSEVFTNDLINSIKDNTNEEFRNKYRQIDILLIDDIQFIGGKHTTEEEFFHTFNHLYQADKQIILSSDRHPKEINTLEERLRSRFEWGLICDIQAPDYETRLAILQKKLQTIDTDVPVEVLDYIASNVDSNIRELEGALTRITAFSQLNGTLINMDLAENILKEYSGQKNRTYTVAQVIKYVSDYFDLTPEDLMSQKRTKEISYARQLAMYICRNLLDYSFPKIGQEFGRDHTTAIHAINKMESDIKRDITVKNDYNDIMKSLQNG